MPAVSVILPTYNRAHLIAETIESVLAQTYSDFELIIVDDGSNDSTTEVVDQFQSNKIRYFKLGKVGRSGARNFGLKQATGSFICFIDSDDLFLPLKIERQLEILGSGHKYVMIYTAAYCINEQGERIMSVYNREDIMKLSPHDARKSPYFKLKSGDIYYDVAFYVPLTVLLPTVMLKREVYEAVGGFDTDLDRFEDIDLWRRISKRFKIFGLDEPTCKIRTHTGNELRNIDRRTILENLNRYSQKVRCEDAEKGRFRIRGGLACLYMFYAEAIFAQSFWIESLPFIRKAVVLNPAYCMMYCLRRKFNFGSLRGGKSKNSRKHGFYSASGNPEP